MERTLNKLLLISLLVFILRGGRRWVLRRDIVESSLWKLGNIWESMDRLWRRCLLSRHVVQGSIGKAL